MNGNQDVDPKLKYAVNQIRKLLQGIDAGGFVILTSKTHSEFAYFLDEPTWSCASLKKLNSGKGGASISFKSKGREIEDISTTLFMLHSIAALASRAGEDLSGLIVHLKKAIAYDAPTFHREDCVPATEDGYGPVTPVAPVSYIGDWRRPTEDEKSRINGSSQPIQSWVVFDSPPGFQKGCFVVQEWTIEGDILTPKTFTAMEASLTRAISKGVPKTAIEFKNVEPFADMTIAGLFMTLPDSVR